MDMRSSRRWPALTILALAVAGALVPVSRAQNPNLGQGWLAEFNLAASQLIALAEATPADKYSWRPAPGVRSVAEVYMHAAVTNYLLLDKAGARDPVEFAGMKENPETKVTSKADVLKWLKESVEAVRATYPKADLSRRVKFLGRDTVAGNVFLRLLVHNHEHMGQAIAYARSIGVTPPWSSTAATKD